MATSPGLSPAYRETIGRTLAELDVLREHREDGLACYGNAWEALRMIREAVETLGPPSASGRSRCMRLRRSSRAFRRSPRLSPPRYRIPGEPPPEQHNKPASGFAVTHYTIDINAKHIPEQRRVWRMFPGENYRFLGSFLKYSLVFLELPGLDLPAGRVTEELPELESVCTYLVKSKIGYRHTENTCAPAWQMSRQPHPPAS
jgi:hypothetical protein